MIRVATFLAATMIVVAATAEDDKKPTAEEIRESKIYAALGDMIEKRNEIVRRFAVVMYGEQTSVDEKHISTGIFPAVFVRASCVSRKFSLSAQWTVDVDGNDTSGAVRVKHDGDVFEGSPYTGWLGKVTKDNPSMNQFYGGHDPFDDYVTASHNLMDDDSFGQIERLVLGRYKLVSSKQSIGGRMIANFEAPVGTEDKVEIEIEFDEPRGMLPLRVTAKYDHKLKFLNTPPYESRFRWKRHKKHGYLPDRIQFTTHVGHQGGGVISEEYAVLCHWLVGDELTDELLDATIEGAHDQTDHLSPLLDHFEIPHSVLIGTDRVGGQHTTPEGLYD